MQTCHSDLAVDKSDYLDDRPCIVIYRKDCYDDPIWIELDEVEPLIEMLQKEKSAILKTH